jgi:hypothetical protein
MNSVNESEQMNSVNSVNSRTNSPKAVHAFTHTPPTVNSRNPMSQGKLTLPVHGVHAVHTIERTPMNTQEFRDFMRGLRADSRMRRVIPEILAQQNPEVVVLTLAQALVAAMEAKR